MSSSSPPTLQLHHQAIYAIAWPMMLSSASVPLLGLVDTALLGHLDSAQPLGAVAIGANVIGLLYWSFGFLRMSTTGLTANAVGKHQLSTKDINRSDALDIDGIVLRALLLGLTLGLTTLLLAPLLSSLLVSFMQASADITPLTLEYIEIRRYSAPAAFMGFAISGWLIGQRRTGKALVLVLVTNGINILLDVWFIAVLGWASAGAAWATVWAEWLGLGLALVFLFQHCAFSRWLSERAALGKQLTLDAFTPLLQTNAHLFMRTVLLMFVLNFFTAQGSVHGEAQLAGNAILTQLILFSAFVIDGFSYAAEVLCGQAYGAKKLRELDTVFKRCLLYSGAVAALSVLIYTIAGVQLTQLLTDLAPVTNAASKYMPWAIAITATGFLAYLLDGVCIGTNQTASMNYSMMISALLVFLPAWWLTLGWGNHGLWFALTLFTIARGVTLGTFWLYWRKDLRIRAGQ